MCGIAAIFGYRGNAPLVAQEELLHIREAMLKRGPDGAGLWVSADQRIGLAHRRLAIIDLSDAGAQPMATQDGTVRIVFNGEIYNYLELRQRLEAKGYRFHSKSDTEVLLYLYQEFGRDMVEHLRGMYAFAIWDQHKRGLFLARDPLGIKPLYYADDGTTIRVASQVKALLKSSEIDTTPEAAGHVGFYLWGHVPEPYTLHRGIRALPAGATLWVDTSGHNQTRQVFNLTAELAKAGEAVLSITREQMHERLRAALIDSVRHHLIADVPVGLFLSAGIDSSILMALAQEVSNGSLHTITLGFMEFHGTPNDEVPLAELVAQQYSTLHKTAWVMKEDFHRERQRILEAMDQPSTDGVNSYFVSKAAAEAGLKVALSGLGGDELFGGYASFRQIPRIAKTFAPFQSIPFLGRGFCYLSAPILKQFTIPKYAGLLQYGGTYGGAYLLRRGMFMPWELPDLLDGEMVREGWKELQTLSCLESTTRCINSTHLKVTALETAWYMRNQLLRDVDWASMAHSLEVRTPLVDWRLLQCLAPILASHGSPHKMELAQGHFKSLPKEIVTRTKTGFSVPVRHWMLEGMGLQGRGLRGWAKVVYRKFSNAKRALILVTDAYGGHGGIAQFNRNFMSACASHPKYREVVMLPRLVPETIVSRLPDKVRFQTTRAKGKAAYVWSLLRSLVQDRTYDVVICGHIYLLPLAWLSHRITGAPLVLIIHGIEAWQATPRRLANRLAGKIDYLIAVSETTRERFRAWASVREKTSGILPNAVDMVHFRPRAKNPAFLDRHRLHGKTVLMTLARLNSSERYKGIDEVLEVMPDLCRGMPRLVYMIAGAGDDRDRLEEKVRALGVVDRVIFAGPISETDKVDYYNLADAFVMPGRGEGFGIVYLEAMACGVPVVGSVLDGSREALLDGKLGVLVNPMDPSSVMQGIREALARGKGIPGGLEHFSELRFQERVRAILDNVFEDRMIAETGG